MDTAAINRVEQLITYGYLTVDQTLTYKLSGNNDIVHLHADCPLTDRTTQDTVAGILNRLRGRGRGCVCLDWVTVSELGHPADPDADRQLEWLGDYAYHRPNPARPLHVTELSYGHYLLLDPPGRSRNRELNATTEHARTRLAADRDQLLATDTYRHAAADLLREGVHAYHRHRAANLDHPWHTIGPIAYPDPDTLDDDQAIDELTRPQLWVRLEPVHASTSKCLLVLDLDATAPSSVSTSHRFLARIPAAIAFAEHKPSAILVGRDDHYTAADVLTVENLLRSAADLPDMVAALNAARL